jgi:catalase
MSQMAGGNPLSNPLQAIEGLIGSVGADPRMLQKSSTFMYANEGPASIAAKITGVVSGGKRKDDGPYFTNNEGIPLPDAAHSLNIGGIPVASDIHLFQKQQHFNRSKPLERMVHPCGSGAFGYFEVTKDVSSLTKVLLTTSISFPPFGLRGQC